MYQPNTNLPRLSHPPLNIFSQASGQPGLFATLGLTRTNIIPIADTSAHITLRDTIPAIVEPAVLSLARTVVKDVLETDAAEPVRVVRAASLADHGGAPDACRVLLGGAHGVAYVVDIPLGQFDVAGLVVAASR
jgi:hypothetical protein